MEIKHLLYIVILLPSFESISWLQPKGWLFLTVEEQAQGFLFSLFEAQLLWDPLWLVVRHCVIVRFRAHLHMRKPVMATGAALRCGGACTCISHYSERYEPTAGDPDGVSASQSSWKLGDRPGTSRAWAALISQGLDRGKGPVKGSREFCLWKMWYSDVDIKFSPTHQ